MTETAPVKTKKQKKNSLGEYTNIMWTWRWLPNGEVLKGYTWNGWWGCVIKSEGCINCYAAQMAEFRGHKGLWGKADKTSRWILSGNNWSKPFKWNLEAAKLGHRRTVFCGSMMDIFEENPTLDLPRQWAFAVMEATPWLNWMLLTKRPELILSMVPKHWLTSWPDNVWAGCSAENQRRTNERLPHLIQVPAARLFVSYEPALEEVDFRPYLQYLDLVICGGESGQNHRLFSLDWARSARNQVLESRAMGHKVLFFFKQVGGITHAAGGRDLDGENWNEIPPEFPEKGA